MSSNKKPNILMIMVDQMRFPRFEFGPEHGFAHPIKNILGFQGNNHDANEYKDYFPGFWKLRENSVVLKNHRIASSACVPSRTALFTGQYGTHTGVLQTDGLFKEGSDKQFPWLEKKSFPTIGSYLSAAGYTSHYFGKWHMSGEDTTTLKDYGFSDWEISYPDPHGTLPNNLGHYRDYQFADNICGFLHRQGLGVRYSIAHAQANVNESKPDALQDDQVVPPKHTDEPTPWYAVASFTNPHDIAAYPGLPKYVNNTHLANAPYTLAVPKKGSEANLPFGGTYHLKLNKSDFPQNNAEVPPHWNEDLLHNNKPFCQFEYKYKMGLSLVAKSGRLASENAMSEGNINRAEQLKYAVDATLNTNEVGLPFALTEDPELASRAFMQYYGYLFSEVDQHINATLKALEDSGQADNTIVIFVPDHGEYGASHGTLMEKWHSAYEEVIHVPMVVKFPPAMHSVKNGLQQINEITSHIDILPTILGLADISSDRFPDLQNILLSEGYAKAPTPVGMNLSELIKTGKLGHKQKRDSVLFMTHDTITEPLTDSLDNSQPEIIPEETNNEINLPELTTERVYNAAVNRLIREAKDEGVLHRNELKKLTPGPLAHPNNVHAVIENSGWKFVRYFNKYDASLPAQYELYHLKTDPNENTNLLKYDGRFPTPMDNEHYCSDEIIDIAVTLLEQLKIHEKELLGEQFATESVTHVQK